MFSRLVAGIGAVLGFAGLVIFAFDTIPWAMVAGPGNPTAKDWLGAIVVYWAYFTHVASFAALLVWLAELTGWRVLAPLRSPVVQATTLAHLLLMMGFFHIFLGPYLTFEGLPAIASVLLHYACPILFAAWWLAFGQHGTLSFWQLPAMLAPGLVYVALILWRGAVIGEYPYSVLDAATLGYPQTVVNIAALLLGVAFIAAALVAIDQLFRPREKLA